MDQSEGEFTVTVFASVCEHRVRGQFLTREGSLVKRFITNKSEPTTKVRVRQTQTLAVKDPR